MTTILWVTFIGFLWLIGFTLLAEIVLYEEE